MADFIPQPVKGPETPPEPQETKQLIPEEIVQQTQQHSRFGQFYADNKWYIWAIVLGLVIITALAAYAFWPRKQERTEAAKVQLTIDSPETAQAGGELIYKIKVLNEDSAKLVDMSLELVYDRGVSYVSSTPKAENISGTIFPVPDLSTGQNAAIIIKTNVQGNINDEKKLVARLRYRFDNFNSPFTKEASSSAKLVASDVVLDVSGPEQANNGEEVKYDVFYRNSSSKDIAGARIQLTYPESFKFSSSEPEPALGQNIWNLQTLKANQNGKVTFKGVFSSQAGQSHNFKAELLALDEEGDYFTQASTSFTTQISTKPLSVEIGNTSSKNNLVDPGGTVSFEIKYRNNTQVVHTGLQVVADVEGSSVVSGSIQPDDGFVQGRTITWNGSSAKSLERLGPGESGSVKGQFKISNPATEGSESNLAVNILPKIKSSQNQQMITGSGVEIKITSPSSLNTSVSHSGGSLPPAVGEESSFKVRLSLSNSTNDFRDGVLVGYIPVGVSMNKDTISAGERNLVKYDAATGKLTWSVGQLVAHSGDGKPERALEFTVSITPSVSQAGQTVTLFKNISYSALDSYTQQKINLSSSDIGTNNLPGGSSNGRVLE